MGNAASAVFLLLALSGMSTSVSAADRHAGIYYPEPQIREEYQARAETLPEADRHKRIEFVNGLTAQMLAFPYPPEFAVFAKGDEAEKLIIVSLYDDRYDTVFRARALLAMLTAVSRQTPFFRKSKVDDNYTFFDLLVLLGFNQVTVGDGDTFAYQITFK
jgi:hypothetical protein